MSTGDRAEELIARYKALTQELVETGDQAVAVKLIQVSMQLAKLGYALTEDEEDWMPTDA